MLIDDLHAYESERQEWSKRDEHLLLRARLVQAQSQGRWIDLLGQFRGFVVEVNMAAGRTVFKVENSPATCLEIEREDGVTISVQFDSALYRVICSEPVERANREYELKVLPVDGNDTVVWVDRSTRKALPDKVIAESLLRTLMRFAPVHA
jgi:hypothetical protein